MLRLCLAVWITLLFGGCSDGYSLGTKNPSPACFARQVTRSAIEHVVVVIQENHSFDSYFANYCTAAPGSNPTCTEGPGCCETGPLEVSGVAPSVLNDAANMNYDPNHSQVCEIDQINGGLMDRFVRGSAIPTCSDARNFAYADSATVSTYWNLASQYALADHYFQPAAGASAENNMYFARGQFVFVDNMFVPNSVGSQCYAKGRRTAFLGPTLGHLLNSCHVSWAVYAEGYQEALANPFRCTAYPEGYTASDIPFQYYAEFRDSPIYQRDYSKLHLDIANGSLPAVSFVKGLGNRTEHPGARITEGAGFVMEVINVVLNSPIYKDNTLILVVYDEGGGYYDHVSPPPNSPVDGQVYGVRLPFLAIGAFVKPNSISHVVMEHSSVVRFIEWNFLDGEPGQLGTRDAIVNNIGSLLDPTKTGIPVP